MQISRSLFSESRKKSEDVRIARNVKLSIDGKLEYAEVQFFFLDFVNSNSRFDESDSDDSENENLNVEDSADQTALALVLLYGRPDAGLLSESFNTLWACERGGPADFRVITVSGIVSLVSMQPLPRRPEDPDHLWFVVEKSGLENIPVNVDGPMIADDVDT